MGKSGAELSAANFANFNDALDSKGVHSKEDREFQLLSWLLLAYAATMDDTNLRAVGASKETLAYYLKGMSKQQFIDTFGSTYLQGDYYAPQTKDNTSYTNLTDRDINWLAKEFNLHRHGLNYVPYDDYPALLHEGETVLTASTADELRLLLDEYRATRQQSLSLDTIVQNQTSTLVLEMEKIIKVIQNNSSFTTNTNLDYVRSSMRTMTSTSGFKG